MPLKIGINGFGRIGRLIFRIGVNDPDIDFVGVNDITDAKTLGHLLKYDSTHGIFDADVYVENDELIVNDDRFKVYSIKNPEELPWKELGADIVVESTGIFRSRDKAALHLDAGAKKVIISAPGKGEPPDFTCVLGINENEYDPQKHDVISNASCTTNCFGPMVKVVNDNFTIKRGFMTTIHAYTAGQNILDAPHKDLRRARAAANSIVPTTTGAAKAIGVVIPEMDGKLDAIAARVPVIDGSLVDFVCEVEKNTSVDEVNEAFKKASEEAFKDIIQYCEDPVVSVDIIGNPYSLIFDSAITKVMNGNLIKLLGWYDNEWGYSSRMVDLIKYVGEKL
jgi:glyceraldehyde-3-phosphate dehydrogenase type I